MSGNPDPRGPQYGLCIPVYDFAYCRRARLGWHDRNTAMTGAQSADVVWLLLAMILVASALFSRRWSLRSAVATALWWVAIFLIGVTIRSEEHTSELQSLMRISYAVICLKKKQTTTQDHILN